MNSSKCPNTNSNSTDSEAFHEKLFFVINRVVHSGQFQLGCQYADHLAREAAFRDAYFRLSIETIRSLFAVFLMHSKLKLETFDRGVFRVIVLFWRKLLFCARL